jgi:hypothetical protein
MHPKTRNAPCPDLFIYYLRGRLRAGSEIFQDNFIGNWEENDESFLFFFQPGFQAGPKSGELPAPIEFR